MSVELEIPAPLLNHHVPEYEYVLPDASVTSVTWSGSPRSVGDARRSDSAARKARWMRAAACARRVSARRLP